MYTPQEALAYGAAWTAGVIIFAIVFAVGLEVFYNWRSRR